VPAGLIKDYDALQARLKKTAKPGDAILCMGARDPELPVFARQLLFSTNGVHRANLYTDPATFAVDRVPDHLFGLLIEVPASVRAEGEAVQAGRALFMIDDGTVGPPVPGLHHRLLAYGGRDHGAVGDFEVLGNPELFAVHWTHVFFSFRAL
jgi:hypothetical protein